jgi:8-oxo-dGTP diphosphatase
MRREYPEAPVAGVGAIIFDGDPRVLLIQRGQEPLKGEWSLPGGAVELGETLDAAVCREVLEETGLVVEAVAVVEVFDRIALDADGRVRFHYVLVDYLCRVTGGGVACATDAADARWFALGELGSIAPFTVAVIEKARSMMQAALPASD